MRHQLVVHFAQLRRALQRPLAGDQFGHLLNQINVRTLYHLMMYHCICRRLRQLCREGARHFVCNAPWQKDLFPADLPGGSLDLVAGPFCNTANAVALGQLARMGFAAAYVSPELPREDFLALPRQSPLPLGVVLPASGPWA